MTDNINIGTEVKRKTVVITGVTGQLGSYLVDMLLPNFTVIGTVRRLSVPNHVNISHNLNNPNFILETMDLSDDVSINNLVQKYTPDYFINCAANSFVGSSWELPMQHMDLNAMGVLRQLEAIKRYSKHTRYLNCGTSEMFGDVLYSPQDELHPLRARSPYGASKIAAHELVKIYRESYGLYAIQPWFFNYESSRRGEEFVTQKICKNLTFIKKQLTIEEKVVPLQVGNIYAKRDWSHALDVANAVWMMLNQEESRIHKLLSIYDKNFPNEKGHINYSLENFVPREYVISSGVTRTVKEFINKCLNLLEIRGAWYGEGLEERFIDDGDVLIEISEKFYRPAEVDLLLGSSDKIKNELGWEPRVSFDKLVEEMILNQLNKINLINK